MLKLIRFIVVGIILLIGLVYILSPIDFFPELLFGLFGYIDDAFVLLMMILLAWKGLL